MKIKSLLGLALLLATFYVGRAQAPQLMNYQAIVRNAQGQPVTSGVVNVRFTIREGSNTGAVAMQETQLDTPNQFGLITAEIGKSGGLSSVNWSNGSKYLEVDIDVTGGVNFVSMGASQLLSVPYALYAGNSAAGPTGATGTPGSPGNPGVTGPTGPIGATGTGTPGAPGVAGPTGANGPTGLAGSGGGATGPIGATGLNGTPGVTGSTGPTGLTGTSITGPTGAAGAPGATGPAGPTGVGVAGPTGAGGSGTGGGTLDSAYNYGGPGAGRIITANSGAVEIDGASAGVASLTTTQSASSVAINAVNSNTSSAYSTIQATTASSVTTVSAILGSSGSGAWGVAGQVLSTGTSEAGIYGNNLRTSGGEGVLGQGVQGVVGENNDNATAAVFGQNTATATGSITNNTPSPGVIGEGYVGVLGETNTDGGVGVFGLNLNPNESPNDNEGVFGEGTLACVEGQPTDATNGYGVASLGNSIAIGDVDATGTKFFIIDHPLDPANKFLKHSCPESNEPIDFYRGNVVCDANGKATVTLPDYFSAININYSYILTAVGAAAPDLHIDKEIEGNVFTIAGGKPGLKVSWQVTSTRNDAYVRLTPGALNYEPEKPAFEKGKYLLPAAYGFGNEKAIFPMHSLKELVKLKGGIVKQQELPVVQPAAAQPVTK